MSSIKTVVLGKIFLRCLVHMDVCLPFSDDFQTCFSLFQRRHFDILNGLLSRFVQHLKAAFVVMMFQTDARICSRHFFTQNRAKLKCFCIAGFFFLWGNLWDANILNIGEEEGVKKEQQSCCY